jgi:protein SCO1/2
MRRFIALSILMAAFGSCTASAHEEDSSLKPPEAALLGNVAFSQHLNEQLPLDAKLTNDRGEQVTLRECIAGKPTIFVFAYYRCTMLCNQVLNGVARAMQAINLRSGEDYSVVVVSIDPTDTVQLAAEKKDDVVHAFRRNSTGEGWHFLIGDQAVVSALAASVGFQYQYDEKSKEYAHASGAIILTPEGRASRYLYGIDFPTRDLRLSLVEASRGKIGTPVDELLLYCFHYDPLTGRYGLAIMRILRAISVATVVALAGYVTISLRRERKQREIPLPRREGLGEGFATVQSMCGANSSPAAADPPPSPPCKGGGTF